MPAVAPGIQGRQIIVSVSLGIARLSSLPIPAPSPQPGASNLPRAVVLDLMIGVVGPPSRVGASQLEERYAVHIA